MFIFLRESTLFVILHIQNEFIGQKYRVMLFIKGKIPSEELLARNKKPNVHMSRRTVQIIELRLSRISEPYQQSLMKLLNGPWGGVLQILSVSTDMHS